MIHENFNVEQIVQWAEKDQWAPIEEQFKAAHPADLAAVITEAPKMLRNHLFNAIDDSLRPHVLAELEGQVEDDILEALSNAEISELAEEMPPDDAADLLAELSGERSAKVLDLMEEEESEEVRELLKYHEESAGGLMTSDMVALPVDYTVEQAMDAIADADIDEPFFYAYIVNPANTLVGYVGLWNLVRMKDRTQKLADVGKLNAAYATTDMDQEHVARLMAKYNISAIPVVDEDHKLVGRITADDVIDVMENEATEDIFMLAGSDDDELEHQSALVACKSRLPWLLITLLTGFVTSLVLKEFMDSISQVLMLTFFVPIVLAMGGSTGVQSSTLIVRGLALGSVDAKNLYAILRKEIVTSLIMGVICGLVIGIWVNVVVAFGSGAQNLEYAPSFLAVTVGVALFCAMMFAALYGAFVPVLLERFKVDPAVASGPFVTASNDIAALLIYYAVTIGSIHLVY